MASPLEINMAGRVFAITGGASGIGLATAELLARHGAAAIWIADMQTSVFETVQKHLSDLSKGHRSPPRKGRRQRQRAGGAVGGAYYCKVGGPPRRRQLGGRFISL